MVQTKPPSATFNPQPIHNTNMTEQPETHLVEIGHAKGERVESSYTVQLKDNANMSVFMQRFLKAYPPSLDNPIAIKWPSATGFSGTFGDETLHFLRSAPEVGEIYENSRG
ncbi:hypothetical protein D9611_008831 [Ephemerocybe angulata]|uniref:Uncharacterized protein n=1 Tax=Ephemerocybe angulata TaxID=980116 RepID=A0A8H5FCK1_9AGAR|nr:hypothetical protein D9611_008831 [Tulosesus angulatus]